MTLPIDDIVIGERSRRELRNVDSLARSIRERGILQPPVVREVDGRMRLVCGQRRLEAMRSLGWTETPVTVVTTLVDEIAALYAESEENTEREPFTVEEAVAHRRRIREAEARAAKERQRAHGGTAPGRPADTSTKLEEVTPRHERESRHRSAKATGYGASTLDKAEKVLDVADDETQPEPVRKIAKESAERLSQHGSKVDREYKSVEKAVAEHAGQSQAYQDAQWRKRLLAELGRTGDLQSFEPERVVAVCDDDQLYLIDSICSGVADWHAAINRLRTPGLRVVGKEDS